ncbi:MAG: methyltransferase domain-containing protein [Chromatiales bacterium]|nr:methyltransferase domain-containing protein [Chromatiales bacterium]
MTDQPFLPAVREQYESFPYPPRDPADELRRLVHSVPASLLAINHHCFNGRRDFRSGFRVLVAGGGTGDAVIFLAEQLRHYDAEVVYLDMSLASRQVAEARARVRKLTNITWVTASIMELPRLGFGPFDYIECAGVLHHLESTEAGLAVLNAVLRDDGAIFLMLYGKYGRQAIYDMQALLRNYLPLDASMAEKVRLTRELLAALPASNSFVRDLDASGWEISTEGFGDAGLYDLLLHTQDRCFDVPGVYALAGSAGLHLQGWAWRAADYEPANLVTDPEVRERVAQLDLPRRHALAELFIGNMRTHEFFLARQPGRGASLQDEGCALRSYGALLFAASRLAEEMVPGPGRVLRFEDRGVTLDIPCTPISKVIYAHMDGRTSIRDLRGKIAQAVSGATPEAIDQELQSIYGQLHPRGCLYLIRAGDYGTTVPDYERLFTTRPQ